MCTATSPGPDCIDLTDIQLRDKYTHLCFLSVVVKGTIHQYTQLIHLFFLSQSFIFQTLFSPTLCIVDLFPCLSLLTDIAFMRQNRIQSVEE